MSVRLKPSYASILPLEQGLQQASAQLQQFQQAVAQQAQQGGATAAQLFRAQQQASTAAAREAMQQARLASQEAITGARTASAERIQASRAAGQAEILAFRQSTEAARQAAREQVQAFRASQAEARSAAPSGGGGVLQGALSVAGGLGIVTSISGMVSALKDFAASMVTTGAQLQQLRASLNVVAGGTQQGAQAFDFITQTANRYGLSLTTLCPVL